MMGSEREDSAAALDAYRAAAHAEADAHFDEHALETQRLRILQRIDQAGHPAKVLRFPGASAGLRPTAPISRRWISVAAAAGLLVGILAGQFFHVLPGDTRALPAGGRSAATSTTGPATARMAVVPARANADAENALLNAIDLAVHTSGSSELRALDDLTFAYEPY